MRLSFLALSFAALLACGCQPPDGGTGGTQPGGGAGVPGSGGGSMPTDPGLPGGDPGFPGGGSGLPGGGAGQPGGSPIPVDPGVPVSGPVSGGGSGLPGGDVGQPGGGTGQPGGGPIPVDPGVPVGGAGMVVVSNCGSEATNPPDGPIAVAVVAGTDQPQSADAYTVLALGESQSFPVSGDTFTIFVCDPADPVNTVYDHQTVNVGSMGAGPVGASSSADLPGGKTAITVP